MTGPLSCAVAGATGGDAVYRDCPHGPLPLLYSRCIACLMLLVAIGVVAAIVVKVVDKDNESIQLPGQDYWTGL